MKQIIAAGIILLKLCQFTQAQSGYTGEIFSANISRKNKIESQLAFSVGRNFQHLVAIHDLTRFSSFKELIADFPGSWIDEIITTEIIQKGSGRTAIASGKTLEFNADQLKLLRTATVNDQLEISISYKAKNSVTDNPERRELHIAYTVIPDTEAEFYGGKIELSKFIREEMINKISSLLPDYFQKGSVAFTIDENGNVINTKLNEPSGNTSIDNIILDAMKRMPGWKPGRLNDGTKVRQEFIVNIFMNGC